MGISIYIELQDSWKKRGKKQDNIDSQTGEKYKWQVNVLVGGLPNNIHNEVENKVNDDDDDVKDKDKVPGDTEPHTKQASQFEVPASENKVELTFDSIGNKFNILSAHEAFYNIISKGIENLSYKADETKDSSTKESGSKTSYYDCYAW